MAEQLLSDGSVFSPQLDEAAIGSDFQQKWCELQKLLDKQMAKGGIIDPEVESNRFLIHINEVRLRIVWVTFKVTMPHFSAAVKPENTKKKNDAGPLIDPFNFLITDQKLFVSFPFLHKNISDVFHEI